MGTVPVRHNSGKRETSNKDNGQKEVVLEISKHRTVGSDRIRKVLSSRNIMFLRVDRANGTLGKASRAVIRGCRP